MPQILKNSDNQIVKLASGMIHKGEEGDDCCCEDAGGCFVVAAAGSVFKAGEPYGSGAGPYVKRKLIRCNRLLIWENRTAVTGAITGSPTPDQIIETNEEARNLDDTDGRFETTVGSGIFLDDKPYYWAIPCSEVGSPGCCTWYPGGLTFDVSGVVLSGWATNTQPSLPSLADAYTALTASFSLSGFTLEDLPPFDLLTVVKNRGPAAYRDGTPYAEADRRSSNEFWMLIPH